MTFVGTVPRAPKWLGSGWVVVAALGLVLAWDVSGLDLALARRFAPGHAFLWQGSWVANVVLHVGMRQLAWVAAAWVLLGIWWPTGVLRDLPRAARVQWAVSLLLGVALVNLLKQSSLTSCPWDLVEFGGTASYVTHWAWGHADGGPGHCFPAGHASAAFAFLGGYFALKPWASRAARVCLMLALAGGFALGLSQQLRGAHFMSHTLWTAWVCWASAWLVDRVMQAGWAPQPDFEASHAN